MADPHLLTTQTAVCMG